MRLNNGQDCGLEVQLLVRLMAFLQVSLFPLSDGGVDNSDERCLLIRALSLVDLTLVGFCGIAGVSAELGADGCFSETPDGTGWRVGRHSATAGEEAYGAPNPQRRRQWMHE